MSTWGYLLLGGYTALFRRAARLMDCWLNNVAMLDGTASVSVGTSRLVESAVRLKDAAETCAGMKPGVGNASAISPKS